MTNIAELLKDAPKGMKLYSPLFGEVEFSKINSVNAVEVIVTCTDGTQGIERFHSNGTYISRCPDAECLLFPNKECRTWNGWKLPVEPKFKVGSWLYHNSNGVHPVLLTDYDERHGYQIQDGSGRYHLSRNLTENEYHLWSIQDAKDGDVLMTTSIRNCPFIYRKTSYNNNLAYYYAGIDGNGDFCEGCLKRTLCHFGRVEDVVPTTKEQRDLLFAKMREAGYTWDEKKKELRKIQPHYDISNFKPFDKVLARDSDSDGWRASIFSHHIKGRTSYPFWCIGNSYSQCIPYEGNEALLGTTDMPSEEFINW